MAHTNNSLINDRANRSNPPKDWEESQCFGPSLEKSAYRHLGFAEFPHDDKPVYQDRSRAIITPNVDACQEATMLRLNRPFLLILLGILTTICVPRAVAQAVDPTGLPAWDSTNQVLFFGYGVEPAGLVRGYEGVRQRGADINIFKEFPGLQEVIVDGLTAGPDDTTLIAAILTYEGHHVRRVILTYNSS